MVSTPPTKTSHPFTRHYIRAAIAKKAYFEAKWYDNPMVSKEHMERNILPLFPGGEMNDRFRQEYLADYTVTDASRRAVPEYDEQEQIDFFQGYMEPELFQRYVGMDIGWTANTAVVFAQYDFRNAVLSVVDEIVVNNKSLGEIAVLVKQKEQQLWGKPNVFGELPPIRRYCDNDPVDIASMTRDHALPFVKVMKATKDAMLNTLRDGILKGRVRVDPNKCPMLNEDLKTGLMNADRTDYERSTDGSHLDTVDALKYLVRMVEWDKNPYGGNKLTIKKPTGANPFYR